MSVKWTPPQTKNVDIPHVPRKVETDHEDKACVGGISAVNTPAPEKHIDDGQADRSVEAKVTSLARGDAQDSKHLSVAYGTSTQPQQH